MFNDTGLIRDMFMFSLIFFVVGICIYYYASNYERFQLKCIVSSEDGNKYCVRDRHKIKEASNLLAIVAQKCKTLTEHMIKVFPDSAFSKQLYEKFDITHIQETLPTSVHTAYSENKGEKIAYCLNTEKNKNLDDLIDTDTLTFVSIHELAHIGTPSIGHETEFWDNFKLLLEEAKKIGIHDPVDYKKNPTKYCSMIINDNPYYDHNNKK